MYEELREMNNEIRRKTEKIAELRAAMTSTSMPLGEKVQTSPSDRLSEMMCRLVMLENELDGMVDDYANLKAMVTGEIFSLDNEDWQDILYSKYVEFKSWDAIAKSKGSNVQAVRQKAKRAKKRLKSIKIDTKSC